jgi:hypothetical protein
MEKGKKTGRIVSGCGLAVKESISWKRLWIFAMLQNAIINWLDTVNVRGVQELFFIPPCFIQGIDIAAGGQRRPHGRSLA